MIRIRKDGKPNGYNGKYNNPEYKNKIAITKVGKLNPNYKGGNSRDFKKYNELSKSLLQKCSICSSINKLIVHHIDGNYKNNILENISIVCRSCHNKIHKSKVRK